MFKIFAYASLYILCIVFVSLLALYLECLIENHQNNIPDEWKE